MLTGVFPPEGVLLRQPSPPGSTANTVTSLVPALTASSHRWLAVSESAACEPRPAPVPAPPVALLPAGVRAPLAARSNVSTAFPVAELFITYTAPGSSCASAALMLISDATKKVFIKPPFFRCGSVFDSRHGGPRQQ